MTDEEKEEVVLSVAAVACGFATTEEVKQQRLLKRKNLEKERWREYLERKRSTDLEKQKRFVRQQLRVSGIISEETEYETITQKYID